MEKYFLFLLITTIVCESYIPIEDTIGYQVHSWNDLGGWEQGFWKGMRWMKM